MAKSTKSTGQTKKPSTALKSILRKITEFSAGIKKDSHSYPAEGENLLDWVKEDSLLRTTLEIKHSTLMRAGYFFIGTPNKSAEDKLKKLRFDKWLSASFWQELIYSNSFTELSKNSTKVTTSLNVIKTDEVEIVNTDTGIVKGYLQIPSNPESTQQVIILPKEKIVHMSYNHLCSNLWGNTPITTLLRVLHQKRLVEDFIAWLFESNQFRTLFKIPGGVNEEDVDTYMEMLKAGMEDPTNFLVIQGDEAEAKPLREITGFKELLDLLDYYRSQVMALMQVPPLMCGILDSSNRSSSEYQVRYSFYTHIYSILKMKADEINNELFPALGFANLEIRFRLLDDKAKNDLLDMAQKLSGMGANPLKLNKWLVDQGLDIPKDLLEEPEEPTPITSQLPGKIKSKVKLDKNSTLHPSRKPTDMAFDDGFKKRKGDLK